MIKQFLLSFLLFSIITSAQTDQDAVLGRWIATDNSVAVNVYKEGNNFRAKVVWFDEHLGSGTPMNSRVDSANPDANLRSRKVIGMDVLQDLKYNSKKDRWENGQIYDASSGRTWDTFAEIKQDGRLFVRGYWKFKWIGKSLYFRRF